MKDFYENEWMNINQKEIFRHKRNELYQRICTLEPSESAGFRTAFIKLNKSKEEHKRTEVQTWINELLWREFYYNITFHNPQIIYESFKPEYDKVIWNNDNDLFNKWCEGQTGYPIVDAGMRQLNLEGWMHNRLRMITAMFLTKDLMMDWRLGEKYFAENLIDLDFSSNNGGWQWSASTEVSLSRISGFSILIFRAKSLIQKESI